MPKLANIKKLQKERAEVARSALANYVDLDSSKEYIDSSSNSDESSNENFELNDYDQANSIIEKNKAFKEAAKGSLKISHFFNNQLSITDHEEDAEDFQSQEYQNEENLNKELDGNLSEELDEETKKIHSAIEFIDNVMREETLFKTEEAHYTAVIYFYRLFLKGQKKMNAAKAVSDVIDDGPWLAKCKFNVDLIMVKDYFEQTILPHLNIKSVQCISVHTVQRWMHKLGFRYQRYKKGVYINGHEHLDIVEYRQTFFQEVVQLEQLMSKWVNPECRIRTYPDLESSEKEHVWITHDETTFYTYDSPHSVWGPKKEQPLQKKGLGSAIHISDFLTETIGSLKDDQEEAHIVIGIPKNFSSKLERQLAFLNGAFSEDALVTSKINLGLGGLVSKMHDTTWNGDHQSMIIENDHLIYDKKKKTYVNLHGQPKEPIPDVIDCCAHRLISNQPDFLEQRGQIQQEIKSCGLKVLFYSKFHSEFNYIEMYLEMAKKYTRSYCEYLLPKTKELIYQAFTSISVEKIHSFTRLSYRWMDAYRHGLTEKMAEYAVRNNRKHRSINEEVMNQINVFKVKGVSFIYCCLYGL
ncbi:4333_t:CDS:2 [Cetraspora pellucida]|uniref:4333_t:CDS:1 n=1 Tax=Cetraspora pellucida TaxID=1433469 RepID=A0A9N9IJ19_9GLOM|nr:4333_t:CDS:2 [Cetraspora pellucida]